METESRLAVARGWVEGEMESDSLMGAEFPSGVMKMSRMFAQHCEYTKCPWILHFKWLMINFMSCEFYLKLIKRMMSKGEPVASANCEIVLGSLACKVLA